MQSQQRFNELKLKLIFGVWATRMWKAKQNTTKKKGTNKQEKGKVKINKKKKKIQWKQNESESEKQQFNNIIKV